MNIKEAKVLITGGSTGIGYAIARVLKEQGAQIMICGRTEETLLQAAKELDVWSFQTDVCKENEVENLFRFAFERLGGLNVLINSAGTGQFSKLTETSVALFQNIWEVNVKGLFLAGREAAKYFTAQNSGNIVNIGSTADLRGYANGSAYVASKFAVSGLTECWRAELRPHNVRVMQVNPSEVITDFITKAGFEIEDPDNKLKPEQIAHLVKSMLAMDDIGFIPDASVWATNPWGK